MTANIIKFTLGGLNPSPYTGRKNQKITFPALFYNITKRLTEKYDAYAIAGLLYNIP